MATPYVLLMFIAMGSSGSGGISAEFYGESACESAAIVMQKQFEREKKNPVYWVCEPKHEKALPK